jgi:hypothetical protein
VGCVDVDVEDVVSHDPQRRFSPLKISFGESRVSGPFRRWTRLKMPRPKETVKRNGIGLCKEMEGDCKRDLRI